MTDNSRATHGRSTSWVPYAAAVVLFWGTWGAFSHLPTSMYGYPDEMVYVIWAFTMLIPAFFAVRGKKFDRRGIATIYGLVIGLTGAGGQLLLFKTLTMGPAYIIFPIIALSPAVTVLMAVVALKERLSKLSGIGIAFAFAAIVLFSISPGESGEGAGLYLVFAVIMCIAWGVQAYYMRKAATVGVNEATTFGWMTISGIVLVPIAIWMMGGLPSGFSWQAPALAAGTQLLNAIGALLMVMAMSRGKASVVAPSTNALYPALTVVLSLIIYQTLPTIYQGIGVVVALVGCALIVYSDEKRAEKAEIDTRELA